MAYTKLHETLVTSTIWREPHATRIMWVTMMAMANKHGEVLASIPGLADMARVTLAECEASLEAFLSPDKYSRTQAYEGRRIERIDGGWAMLNHEKYRTLCSKEDEVAATAERVRRHRARAKAEAEKADRNAQVTPGNAMITDDRDIAEAEAKAKAKEEQKTKTARKRAAPVALVSVDVLVEAGFDESTAAEFIAHKSQLKAPLTARAWADHLAESRKAGWHPKAAAVKVIAKSWKGFEAKYVASEAKPTWHDKRAEEAAKWLRGTSLDRSTQPEIIDANPIAIR